VEAENSFALVRIIRFRPAREDDASDALTQMQAAVGAIVFQFVGSWSP
jgi:hypothetical protein